MGADDLSLLAQRAASEGPRWTRAVEDRSAPIPGERTSKLGRMGREQPGALLARRTRTFRKCSPGTRARLGALGVGRVRMLRAVASQPRHPRFKECWRGQTADRPVPARNKRRNLSKRLLRFPTIPLSVDSHTQWGGQEIGMCGKVGAVG